MRKFLYNCYLDADRDGYVALKLVLGFWKTTSKSFFFGSLALKFIVSRETRVYLLREALNDYLKRRREYGW